MSLIPRSRTARAHILFLAVPILLFGAFYIYPIAASVRLSLHDWNGFSPDQRFVGLRNYAALWGQPRFINAVLNNLAWVAFMLTVPTGIGLALAAILDRGIRGETMFRIIFFLPFTIPAVSVGAIWRWMYEPSNGLLTTTLELVGLGGLAQNWLGDPDIVTFALMGAVAWWTTGFAFLVFFAGLRNIPEECIEAARIEGGSDWQIFWKVSFPLLWPSTIIVLGISAIDAMRLFDVIWATTKGGPAYASEVLAVQMYDLAFGRFQMGRASAVAVSLLVLSAVVIMPYIWYMTRRVQDAEVE
ncbi:sugar ABC transporter permease [Psychromarinibacter sp. C21-152]|uniref:Sugar ABC transporter permease n=1 Tax=Psychromarinibacter sediminicola TaxID=3033385 RepID=A0AAE3T7X0_9RHOB|nr:sugar ABC transporter permease [Psychromarinibacter sediminicola]MDF0599469.1 sugar ABC transporter permease [Psychromarinibacter sediminicola]